ncbi:hypothetical protein DFJ63DRAFT_216670 [Scheffersomyces coipomensis]|uniref:uncharacterized protein n=1 Tax=Scheffersomyces coipomensis TaxID=1788519 RepID=UPI00315D6138
MASFASAAATVLINVLVVIQMLFLWLAPKSFTGAACGLVNNQDIGNDQTAFIEIISKTGNISQEFPILIFKYTDLDKFQTLPTVDEYKQSYKNDRQSLHSSLIDPLTSIFNLQPKEIIDVDYFNGFLIKDESTGESKFNMTVHNSGYYCVYMLPAHDLKIYKDIKFNFHNSFGNLSNWGYILQTQAKFAFPLSVIILVSLFYYVKRFKRDGDKLLSFDSVSFISKIIIEDISALFTALQLGLLIILYILNKWQLNRANVFALLLFMGYKGFGVAIFYYTTQFFAGYGVFQSFPSITIIDIIKNKMIPEILVITNLVLILWESFCSIQLLDLSPFHNNYGVTATSIMFIDNLKSFLSFILTIFPLIWISLIIKAYFKKFGNLHSYKQQSLLKNLKLSMVCLMCAFALPTLLIVVLGLHAIKEVNPSIEDMKRLIVSYMGTMILPEEKVQSDIFKTKLFEYFNLKSTILTMVWGEYIKFFLLIGIMFIMWIKDNRGIPVTVGGGEGEAPAGGEVPEEIELMDSQEVY